MSYDKLDLMMKKKMVGGQSQLEVSKGLVCAGCQFGKAHQQSFERSSFQQTVPLELVHLDVFGPVKQPSVKGMRYMVTFIDDFSRYVWIYFMKEKYETFSKFKEFRSEAESLTMKSIRCLRSENGGEFLALEFTEYLKSHIIKRQMTCPNTQKQNGVSKSKNYHLAETSGSMIHDKNVSK